MDDDGTDIAVLVAAAGRGDQAAWDEIVERYTPLVIRVVLRYRLTSGEAEDVAQTVWLHLIEHLDDLRESRALPMWIVTTAKREALRCAVLMSRTQLQDPQDAEWQIPLVSEAEFDADLERSERHAALLEGLATLSPRQRQVMVILAEDPPVPYAEISRRIGIPIGAIGPTRARALERLRGMPFVQALMTTAQPETSGRQRT